MLRHTALRKEGPTPADSGWARRAERGLVHAAEHGKLRRNGGSCAAERQRGGHWQSGGAAPHGNPAENHVDGKPRDTEQPFTAARWFTGQPMVYRATDGLQGDQWFTATGGETVLQPMAVHGFRWREISSGHPVRLCFEGVLKATLL